MGNNNTKDHGGSNADAAPVLGELSNSRELPWIQHDNLPSQAIAVIGCYYKELRILDLRSGTSCIYNAKISDHMCCGIVAINDKVYAVTEKEILQVHGDGSVTTLQLLEKVAEYSQVVSFQKKIYIIQPNGKHTLCLDPDNNSFNDALPGCGLKEGFFSASSHNFIFAMGGSGTEKSAMKFDPLENTWTRIASMRTGSYCAAAACVDEKIYMAGGRAGGRKVESAEFYSPDDDIWTQIPNMNTCRYSFSFCVIGNQLYAIGGDRSNTHEHSVEVYNEGQWMMVTKYKDRERYIYACVWPQSRSVSSTNIDEEYRKLKVSHATTITKDIGKKGGKFEISGCKVQLPLEALAEEKEITFLARVDQNQEKGLLTITPALECDPPMKLDKAATVTMRTSISANAGESIPVTLFTQKHRQGKWNETEQLSLKERNEVEFKVKECSGMKIATKSSKGKFHLISDFYIHSPTAKTAVIFSKDEVIQSLVRKQLLKKNFHEFALVSHDVQGEMGSEISVSMEHKEPAECSLTDGLPSSTFKVNEDYVERGKQAIYYDLEPEPSDQHKRVHMLFGYKVGGEKEQSLSLKSEWPPTKPERVKPIYIGGKIENSEININTGDQGCAKKDESITAGNFWAENSQNDIDFRDVKITAQRDCPGTSTKVTME